MNYAVGSNMPGYMPDEPPYVVGSWFDACDTAMVDLESLRSTSHFDKEVDSVEDIGVTVLSDLDMERIEADLSWLQYIRDNEKRMDWVSHNYLGRVYFIQETDEPVTED